MFFLKLSSNIFYVSIIKPSCRDICSQFSKTRGDEQVVSGSLFCRCWTVLPGGDKECCIFLKSKAAGAEEGVFPELKGRFLPEILKLDIQITMQK